MNTDYTRIGFLDSMNKLVGLPESNDLGHLLLRLTKAFEVTCHNDPRALDPRALEVACHNSLNNFGTSDSMYVDSETYKGLSKMLSNPDSSMEWPDEEKKDE